MKRFLTIIAAVLASCTLATAQQKEGNQSLAFTETEWNFGTINEMDGEVSHTFHFKNNSSAPVIIERVITTCGCTTPTYPHQPVYAGKEGDVTVTYNPEDRPGRFTKTVTIITGNGKQRNVLTIKGTVNARPKTVEDNYPYLLGQNLRTDNAHLSFGYLKQGGTKSMTIQLVNTSNKSLKIDTVWHLHSGFLKVAYPQSINPGKKATVTLTYDLGKRGKYGIMSDQFRFVIDGKEAIMPINTDGTGVDDMSKANKRTAPILQLSSGFVNFGSTKAGANTEKTLTITNKGTSTLIIRNVQCRNNTRTSLKAGTEIAKGESKEFTVKLIPGAGERGSVFGNVVIVSNDTDRPMREIRLNANVE